MPRKGGKRKKTRTQPLEAPEGAKLPDEIVENIPRSIVARISKVSVPVKELVLEMRKLMGPYTATNLRERSFNRMKDYEAVAGNLNVSHLLFFSETERNITFRIAKHPNGPTLHFHLAKFMLQRQVKASQKRPFESLAAYQTPPVLVLNNFGQAEENHVKLMKITFQNMFRTINVKTVKLSDCRRVVLFHYHKETGLVEMRHYAIRANPVGISRNMKKIIQSKIPNLGELEDISQFLDGSAVGAGAMFGGSVSDSEAEDEGSRVTLPDRFIGRGNAKSQLSAMKLTELGPRLTLELYKVQQGLNEGDIIFHKFVQKTAEEAAATKARVEKQKKLKEERKKIQEQNVKRKREALEEKRKLKAERKRQRLENGEAAGSVDDDDDEDEESDNGFDGEYEDNDDDEDEVDDHNFGGREEGADEFEEEEEEERDDDDDDDDEEEEEEEEENDDDGSDN